MFVNENELSVRHRVMILQYELLPLVDKWIIAFTLEKEERKKLYNMRKVFFKNFSNKIDIAKSFNEFKRSDLSNFDDKNLEGDELINNKNKIIKFSSDAIFSFLNSLPETQASLCLDLIERNEADYYRSSNGIKQKHLKLTKRHLLSISRAMINGLNSDAHD